MTAIRITPTRKIEMRWVLVISAAALVLAAYYCAAEETPTAQVGDESRRNVVWRSNDRSPLNQLRYVFEDRGRLYMVSEAPAGYHYTYASGGNWNHSNSGVSHPASDCSISASSNSGRTRTKS